MLQRSYISGVHPAGDQVELAVRLAFLGKMGHERFYRHIIPADLAADKARRMHGNQMNLAAGIFLLEQPVIQLQNDTIHIIANNLR
ncbi:hypothetical protein D3C73_1539590 [compost metagenome]